MLAACAAASGLYLTAPIPYLIAGACCCTAGLAITLGARRHAAGICAAAVCAGLVLGGGVRLGLEAMAARSYLPVDAAAVGRLEGRVLTDGRRGRSGFRAELAVDRLETETGSYSARLRVPVYGLERRPRAGARLSVAGELAQGEQGLYLGAEGARRLAQGPSAAAAVRAARGAVAARLDGAARELGAASGLLRALLLGRSDSVSPRVRGLFRASGTAHILALSGMHLGILIALALAGLTPLLGRRRALTAALVLVVCYLGVVGFRASLARAALMFALGFGAVALDRRPEPTRILAASFLLLSLLAPRAVDGLSFQLSFAALAGILVIGRWVDRLLVPWVPRLLRSACAASLGAQLATLPLVVAAFGVARPIGVVATLVMAPLAVLLIWAGVGALALSAVTGGAAFAAVAFLELLQTGLLGAAQLFARAPGLWMSADLVPVLAAGAGTLTVSILLLDARPRYADGAGERGGGRCGHAGCGDRARAPGPPDDPDGPNDPDNVRGLL